MTVSAQKFTRQQLLSVHAWSPKLFSLRCTRDPGFRFRAGQFVRLGVRKASGSIIWRAYSVVSAPHDEFLEFFSIVVPGGEFTSELSRLRAGDELLVEKQATGFLTLDRFPDGRDGRFRVFAYGGARRLGDGLDGAFPGISPEGFMEGADDGRLLLRAASPKRQRAGGAPGRRVRHVEVVAQPPRSRGSEHGDSD